MIRHLVAFAAALASLLFCAAERAAARLTVASLGISAIVEPRNPEVGDRVSIAFDVFAYGTAGLPAYQLRGAEELFAGEFRPAPDGSTFPDRVVFELTALRPGVAEIQLHVDYEAQHCDGEHCYWAFRGQLSSVVRIEVGTGEPGDELPDLVATRIALLNDTAYCLPGGIYFCVENRGTADAEGFQVLLNVVGGGSSVRFLTQLEAGGQEVCFAVPTADEGSDLIPNRPGERLEVIVDAMHEVDESDEGNNRRVFDIPVQPAPPGGCPTPTPTPSARLHLSSTGFGFPCDGSLDVIVSTIGAPGESVTVDEIELWHGYSQGDYGTAFHWDLTGITLPTVLASGAHLSIPVTYPSGGAFNSRLHVEVHGTSGNGSGVDASAVFRGAYCGTPISTATPTPTPTPLPTGDLGEVEVNGVALGPGDVGVPGALVTFRVVLQAPSFGQTTTGPDGRFSFRIRLHDTDSVEVRIDAPGYLTNLASLRATEILGIAEFRMIPIAPDGPLAEVDSALCALDCDGNLHVAIDELVGAVAIAIGGVGIDRCGAADVNEDGRVSVAEVVTGVNNALAGCRPIASDAVGRLDQLWGGSTGGICGLEQEALHINASGPLAQEFVPTATQLSGVAILLHRGSTVRGAGVDVAIRAGSIDGPVIATARTQAQIYFEDWVQFEFDPPLTVTPGATYVIVPGTESPYFLWVGLQGIGPNCESSGYAGGDAFVEGARDPSTDFVFATFAGE